MSWVISGGLKAVVLIIIVSMNGSLAQQAGRMTVVVLLYCASEVLGGPRVSIQKVC